MGISEHMTSVQSFYITSAQENFKSARAALLMITFDLFLYMVNFSYIYISLVTRSFTWLVHDEWGWYADRCDGGQGNGKQPNEKTIESKLQFSLIHIFSKKWVSKTFLHVFQYQITVCYSFYAHSLSITVHGDSVFVNLFDDNTFLCFIKCFSFLIGMSENVDVYLFH